MSAPAKLLDQARAALEAGRASEAEGLARRVLGSRPQELDARVVVAQALEQQGRLPEAIREWMDAFALDPSRAPTALGLALAMSRHGQTEHAVEVLGLALRLHPDAADLSTTRGNLLRALGRYEEALEAHRQALASSPRSAAIHANLSALYLSWKRPQEALAEASTALELAPGAVELRFNLGTCLLTLERAAEAAAVLAEVVAVAPRHASAWLNLGEARLRSGDAAGAEAAFRRAVEADPSWSEAHFNLALRLLARGAFEEGWREYEWRRRVADIPRRRLEGPAWDGQPMPGRTLLVTAEQGLGDTFQFARFLGAARERAKARLVFECPPALEVVLNGLDGVDELVPVGHPLPSWDAQASLLSLPFLTGASVAASGPYVRAEASRVEAWRRRLAGPARWVAIAWQGNPAYRADAARSIPLAAFTRLARVPGVKLVSVQRQHGREQLAQWPKEVELLDVGAELDAAAPFVDTAAVLAAADLVVTSDTSVPHLAGALGRPVWLALASRADWRWGVEPSTTAWYERFRLFRQEREGDWDEVFGRIEAALRQLAGCV